ncbi:MAG TPA: amidase [Sphingomonas sp.]|nr:amidase [Sphingomonas sp.]
MRAIPILALAAGALAAPAAAQQQAQVEERSIDQLRAAMAGGSATSEAITRAYLARIAAMDRTGPALRAVIALNPDAIAEARAADARRKAGSSLGPLDGIPILVKDNIETSDPVATTAGSLALADNVTHRDAPVVANLRAAGAVILGKTNLSEWANIRSTRAMSGWSGVGGLVRNPYAFDRTACGSSSGSGAAVAASFAAAALGTETDGSVVCPSSVNGLVGLKPTIGLVSRTHIVPISHSQDTAGPMGRSVRDVAELFSAMIGSDPADPATAEADAHKRDYAAALKPGALKGMRIGVIRPDMPPHLAAAYDAALAVLKAQGAVLVDVAEPKLKGLGDAEQTVLETELKADLNAYLATTPASVTTRTLADVIAFDDAHAAAEMPYFGQEFFLAAEKTKGLGDPAYTAARAKSLDLARKQGIEAMLAKANAAVLVEPTYGPAWLSDPVYGDQYNGPSSSTLPAVAGTPNLTVPMGLVDGLPAGLSFMGPAFSEATLFAAGYDYEQASHARVPPKYLPTADVGPGMDGAAR